MIRIYNIFPRNYSNFLEIKSRVAEIKKLGFNIIWINPFQMPGEAFIQQKTDLLTGSIYYKPKSSIYSMGDDELFLDGFTTEDLKKLSKTCHSFNIILMFDLVIGHIAPDSCAEFKILKIFLKTIENERIKELLDNKDIKTYKDFLTQIISEPNSKELLALVNDILIKSNIYRFTRKKILLDNQEFEILEIGRSSHFQDTTKIIYYDKITKSINTNVYKVIDEFWKPFIAKYVKEYGFLGIRVDSAMRIPFVFRKYIYDFAKSIDKDIIIFEENLFKEDFDETIKKIGNTGADYMTSEIFYHEPDIISGFPKIVNDHLIQRDQLVARGCITFTGNHDEIPLALTILRNMAFDLAKADDKDLEKPSLDVAFDHIKLQPYFAFLYKYVVSVVNKINSDDDYKNTFLTKINERLSYIIFSTSGGYYMLDGDEKLSIRVLDVFDRKNVVDLRINHSISDKILEMNKILETLPSFKSLWFEYFKYDDDMSIIVRKNGFGFDNDTVIIFCNNNPRTEKILDNSILHKLACWFQKRTKPVGKDFDIIYNIINGLNEYKSKLFIFTCGNVKINFNSKFNVNRVLHNGRD